MSMDGAAITRTVITWVRGKIGGAITFLLNFLREHTPESATRICMLMLCYTGCKVALRTVDFAFLNKSEHLTIAALTTLVTALIYSGCVAIALRTRSADSASAACVGPAADPKPE